MVSQVIHVLGTYRRPMFGWFLIFAVLWTAFFKGLMLFPGGLQRYLTFSIVLSGGLAFLVGRHFSLAFVPCRARLEPGFARAQFAAASLVALPVLAVMIALAEGTPSGSATLVGVALINSTCVLAGFALGWFAHPILWGMVAPLLFLIAMRRGVVGAGMERILSGDGHAVLLVLLVNIAGVILLARRMLGMHEEAWERSLPQLRAFPKWQDRLWLNEDRWWVRWGLNRMDTVLRKVQFLPGGDRRSRVKLLEIGLALPTYPPLPVLTGLLILLFWAASMVIPTGRTGADVGRRAITMFLFYPSLFMFTTMTSWKRNLPSTLLLPAPRGELMRDFGAIFLRQTFRYAAAFALFGWTLQWMPRPFEMRPLPSPAFFLSGLAVQLPLFALVTLLVLNPRGWRAALAVVAGFHVWVAFVVLAEVGETMLLTILALAAGIPLIIYAYRRWLNVEVD